MLNHSATGSFIERVVYGTSLKRTLIRATILAVTCIVTAKFIFIPVRIDGASMVPTYSKRGLNFVNRLAYMRTAPQRGDVVAVRMREHANSVFLMKRVVGLPGERIGFEDGTVTVNGERLAEPYVEYPSDWDMVPVECGVDEYFVVGDNRSMPMEDHWFGRAKANLIAGRMML